MKNLFNIAITVLLVCGCRNTVIESGDMTLSINADMHYRVESAAEGAGAYHADYQAADALIADEVTIDRWNLRDVMKCDCEEGKKYTIR